MYHEDLLDGLTEPQRQAVTHTEGPLLVLAGAGSGKTRVITRRAAHIARTVARPDQVLAITFTNKAAGEMRERIADLGVGGRMWVCTFHSLCARLLREYGHALDIRPGFSIFDESDRRSLIKDAIAACDLRAENWKPRTALAVISDAKNKMLTPESFAEQAYDFNDKTFARVYEEYQRALREQNACDFDDLLMYVATLLDKNDAIRDELSDRFRYLLIDEYQDTNRAQYLIATRLSESHRNICATGDPDQSIYAWRGADIRNILDFEADYTDATVVRLEQNFRSTGAILSAASSLISKNEQRKHKDLWTDGEQGTPVAVWDCEDEREEAEAIANDIRSHLDGGGQGSDIAIFYRVNALSRVLEDALRAANVPYQIARGVEFYSRKEIKNVLAWLRTLVNPADEIAVHRALGAPTRGIGKTTTSRLVSFARGAGITMGEAIAVAGEIPTLKTARTRKKLAEFANIVAELRAMPPRPVRDVVQAMLKKSGMEESLSEGDDTDNERLTNVYELINAAQQYDLDNPEGSLAEWLHQISLVSDADSVQLSGGPVTLMTLHTAKGLEFPIVYVVGLEESLLPHARAIMGGDDELEEERRLCFVGMTRAMRKLTLSSAQYRMVRGITERTLSSRFLRELPQDEIERFDFETEDEGYSTSHLGRHNRNSGQMDGVEDGFSGEDYYPGCRVRHDEYGEGEVIGLDQRAQTTYVRIHFKHYGERKFALEHVSLYILEP